MRLLLIPALFFFSIVSFAQSYSVLHVVGRIYDTRSGSYLSTGSKLDATAKLRFDSPGAKAALLSPEKGRFILQQTGGSGDKNDLFYTLAGLISPVKGRLSTRSGAISSDWELKEYFNRGAVAWIGEVYVVFASTKSFGNDKEHYFYASYVHRQERINKKLTYRNDSLLFVRSSYFSVDGHPVDPAETSGHVLIHVDEKTGNIVESNISSFVLVSDEVIAILSEGLSDLKGQAHIDALTELVSDLYGQVSDVQVSAALNRLKK